VHVPSKIDPATQRGESLAYVPRALGRVLIAGVGYRNLRDLSIGPVLIDRLKKEKWPSGVEVEDLSYGPIGVMHNFDDRPPYDKIIFLAGVNRNRRPGQVSGTNSPNRTKFKPASARP
jgi:Ni,Fe-hydrogenase maturation factor